ncbi:hypothetical protein [Rhodosalinus sp. 5P4]|uniref:hypothetical protein n=1 Tax=Rhodosalinus sp. 5P4 TaxID=3239196 RepID=UPI003523942F
MVIQAASWLSRLPEENPDVYGIEHLRAWYDQSRKALVENSPSQHMPGASETTRDAAGIAAQTVIDCSYIARHEQLEGIIANRVTGSEEAARYHCERALRCARGAYINENTDYLAIAADTASSRLCSVDAPDELGGLLNEELPHWRIDEILRSMEFSSLLFADEEHAFSTSEIFSYLDFFDDARLPAISGLSIPANERERIAVGATLDLLLRNYGLSLGEINEAMQDFGP